MDIGTLARQVQNGALASCRTLSPMPAAVLWLAKLTHVLRAEVFWPGARIGGLQYSSYVKYS